MSPLRSILSPLILSMASKWAQLHSMLRTDDVEEMPTWEILISLACIGAIMLALLFGFVLLAVVITTAIL